LQFCTTSSCVNADIEVSDSLCISVVGFKGIVTCEDFVKVDIPIEQDVIPLSVGEDRTSLESEDGLLQGLEVNTVVIFELEHEFKLWINGGMAVRWVIECEEGFIGVPFPRINTFSHGLFVASIPIALRSSLLSLTPSNSPLPPRQPNMSPSLSAHVPDSIGSCS